MSTATAPARRAPEASAPLGPPRPLAGTGALLRFMLRRDRIRFFGWTLGLTMMLVYFSGVLRFVFPNPEDLQTIIGFTASPVGALLGGPGFGYDDLTLDRFLVSQYGLYLITGAGLMGILTVMRHTRREEQAGRAELLRASAVGRVAQHTAALLVAVLMSVVVAVLYGAVLTAQGTDAAGAFTFGASVGAAGIAFAGLAATTAQLTAFSRAGSGIAGTVLGLSFLVRGLGDMSSAQGGDLGWLSWLSPIGWSQQTAPYVYDRWWPLALSLAFAAVCAGIGFWLAGRRDLGSGLIAARRGSPAAAPWLASPFALAFRLQRSAIIGWTLALFASAIAYGSFSQPLVEGFVDAPPELLAIMGAEDDILSGYLGLMGLMMAFFAVIFAILSVQSLRGEELDGRGEGVLTAAVGRGTWMTSWLVVAALAVAWLQFASGVGQAIGASTSTGDWSIFWDVVLGHVAHSPAVWVVLAVAALLYGWLPRLLGVVWVLFGYAFIVGFFGPLFDLPDVALWISPFEHIGEYPGEELSGVAMLVLAGVAVVVAAIGVLGFRRRDLISD
ncbi:exporter of polyketide antibiotics [Agromyces rhizosphaerae]|uniref:Exporter of polyketide antibiotics n=1 Tax=Agromyces rhizosphaerae TaxID=88374 RepID=A0A9W6FS20_9MICO|nr:ABC transporter permease [Agromyces rhizosphaerae]GLI27693.1 exporter of polyketide antibiotics [Agromyces rhizosphaerae]